MSKYNPLSERLSADPQDEWRSSFGELEQVLGFPLPKAARSGRAWWANDPEKPHSRAWAAQGWEVGEVDTAAGEVVFRRRGLTDASPTVLAAMMGGPEPHIDPNVRLDAPEEPQAPRLSVEASTPPPAPDRQIQPPAMREAAESASSRMHATRSLGVKGLVAVGAAVAAGLSAVAIRGLMRRRA